ncbi:MAG: preprotein translocase subunit YajC [Candidatus Omnitrophica bacterium]|nr:preprotein translocase subunit YajC [Candidatus Omnitrophota bacterium]
MNSEVNPLVNFVPFILVFVIFYFFLIRPQQKRQKELAATLKNLKKGDRVITSGGLIGTVQNVHQDYLVLKLGDNDQTKVEVLKSAVTGLRNT